MKKVIAILLGVVLLITSALAAAPDDYVGTWVSASRSSGGGAICEMFMLTADGKVFYMNEMFGADSPTFGRQNVNTWNTTKNGIHIVYGENAEADAFLQDGFLMLPGVGGYIPFGKAAEWGASNSAEPAVTSGDIAKISDYTISYVLPFGVYFAGREFPAGTYDIIGDIEEGEVNFVAFDQEASARTYDLYIEDGGKVDSVVLPDGIFIMVWSGRAILNPVEEATP